MCGYTIGGRALARPKFRRGRCRWRGAIPLARELAADIVGDGDRSQLLGAIPLARSDFRWRGALAAGILGDGDRSQLLGATQGRKSDVGLGGVLGAMRSSMLLLFVPVVFL